MKLFRVSCPVRERLSKSFDESCSNLSFFNGVWCPCAALEDDINTLLQCAALEDDINTLLQHPAQNLHSRELIVRGIPKKKV